MEYFKLTPEQGFLIGQKAVIRRDDKILLLKAKQWDLPGGLIDFGEDIQVALHREIMEEAALTATIDRIFVSADMRDYPFKFDDGRILNIHFIMLGYLCDYVSGEVRLSEEHSEFAWVTRDELVTYTMQENAQFATDAWLKLSLTD